MIGSVAWCSPPFSKKGFNVFNLVLYKMNLACVRGNLSCSLRELVTKV